MNYLHAKNKRGFTLLETLVAISIIGIALVAATSALQNALQTSNFVKDQITAYYLAEDAMEYVVNLRNTGAAGIVAGNASVDGQGEVPSWASNLLPCMPTNQTSTISIWCSVDTYNNTVQNYANQIVLSADMGTGVGISSATTLNQVQPLYICEESDGTADGTIPVYTEFNDGHSCTQTKFSREVTIRPVQCLLNGGTCPTSSPDANSFNEIVVTVTVTWGGDFGQQSYTLVDDLYNWQPAS